MKDLLSNIVTLGLISLYLLWVTWILYLAVTNLRIHFDKMTRTTKILGAPIVLLGALYDVVLNAIVGSLIFWERPKEWLFTSRCERWLSDDTWRGTRARWFCRVMLDPFDKDGTHCGGRVL